MKHNIHCTVNGEPYDLVVESHHSLLQVLREQLVLTGTKNGCEAWGENINDLDIVNGQVISYRTEESLPLLKNMVVYGLQRPDGTWTGGPVLAQGRFMPEYVTPLVPETGQGPRAVVHFTTGAQAVEVEVDTETGEVQVLKIVSAYDVGRAINPEMVRTQMEGGAVQGMSTALFKSLILDQRGVPRNANFTDYRIATAVDAPLETENIIIEAPQDDGPFGARGIGEHPMVPNRTGDCQRDLQRDRRAHRQHADQQREGLGCTAGEGVAVSISPRAARRTARSFGPPGHSSIDHRAQACSSQNVG